MGVRRRVLQGIALAAWVVTGVMAADVAPPRVYHLALVFAASLTVPLLTNALVSERLPRELVKAARGSVRAYTLGVNDCKRTHPDADAERDKSRMHVV